MLDVLVGGRGFGRGCVRRCGSDGVMVAARVLCLVCRGRGRRIGSMILGSRWSVVRW